MALLIRTTSPASFLESVYEAAIPRRAGYGHRPRTDIGQQHCRNFPRAGNQAGDAVTGDRVATVAAEQWFGAAAPRDRVGAAKPVDEVAAA